MHISFSEPVSPRYIYINPETNKVHLMVPMIGGQEISTDNTCKAKVALREFFDGEALNELNKYKQALVLDIALLDVSDLKRASKEIRLAQIEAYIEAVSAMRHSYSDAITALLARPSNLYAIQLRPLAQDSQSRVVNPAFNIERSNDAQGTPRSALFQAMYRIFPNTTLALPDPRAQLISAVMKALPPAPQFVDIQRVLSEQFIVLFGSSIDFTKQSNGTVITKAVIDNLMRFGADAKPGDYIEGLLGACAPNLMVGISTPPFYSIPQNAPQEDRIEQLSILTQFFLANLNIYCRSKGISSKNFGVILDGSAELSNELVSIVSTALSTGDDVEKKMSSFFNIHAAEFGLSRSLTAEDESTIKQKYERTYRTVTATKENPHMDDFMILDTEATGEDAKFVTHQGTIGVDFAEIVDAVAASANPDYFASIRADFANHPIEIPHKNEWVAGGIDLEPEVLLARLDDDQFEQLPQSIKEVCRAHPIFLTHQFLHDVAKGKQAEAENLLTITPANTQILLKNPGVFTDYSGRTFNCTAYEYAYWAKDTHMCRMLEGHMDEETKAHLLARIAFGLTYKQHGETHYSAHFDFTPLKQALQHYNNGFNNWQTTDNWEARDAAWLAVGMAQRDVPAHVAHEYCRPGRSFNPTPQFNEATLPRVLTFYDLTTILISNNSWFPLDKANTGLGVDFALLRGDPACVSAAALEGDSAGLAGSSADLAAIIRLDEVRTSDLTQSRDNLKPSVNSPGLAV